MKHGFKSTYLLNSLLLVISLTAVSLVSELLLRILNPKEVILPHPPGMYTEDPVVGYVLSPGFQGWYERSEYRKHFSTNSDGYRGEEIEPPSPDTLRIVCLGDSFTWGVGAGDGEVWPHRLQEILQERYPGLDIQVINAGVPGYGNDEELEFLKARGANLDPDVVIVQFFSENDFDDNRKPARETRQIKGGILHEMVDERDELRPLWLRAHNVLENHSRLFSLVSGRISHIVRTFADIDKLKRRSGLYFSDEDGAHTTDLLVRIGLRSQELGATVVYMPVPGIDKIVHGEDGNRRAFDLVEAAADQIEAQVIDLAPALLKRRDRSMFYYPEDRHWTPEGHLAVAGILAEYLATTQILGRQ